jgi:hypothetical protein
VVLLLILLRIVAAAAATSILLLLLPVLLVLLLLLRLLLIVTTTRKIGRISTTTTTTATRTTTLKEQNGSCYEIQIKHMIKSNYPLELSFNGLSLIDFSDLAIVVGPFLTIVALTRVTLPAAGLIWLSVLRRIST